MGITYESYQDIFVFVQDSIYLSNLSIDQKRLLLNQIETKLSVVNVHLERKELLVDYKLRCNKFIKDNEIVVNIDEINKYMNENKITYNDYLSMKKKEVGTIGGRHREMNLKDIKEVCKVNQIKLSRVVDGKRVAYKKKELMTKLKRKKLL
jgi:hypothetical protein